MAGMGKLSVFTAILVLIEKRPKSLFKIIARTHFYVNTLINSGVWQRVLSDKPVCDVDFVQ